MANLQKQLKAVKISPSPKRNKQNPKSRNSNKNRLNDFSSDAFTRPVMAPMAAQLATKQTSGDSIATYRLSDYIGEFGVLADPSKTPVSQIFINPLLLEGSRFQSLARNSTHYRIRKMMMRVNTALPTTIGASFVIGFDPNPDSQYSIGVNGGAQVYTLRNAVNTTGFLPITCHADHTKEWLVIDGDSPEIMKTTCGKFCLQQFTSAAISASMYFPVFLDIIVDFKGSAKHIDENSTSPTVVSLLDVTITNTVAVGTGFHFVISDDTATEALINTYSAANTKVQIYGSPLQLDLQGEDVSDLAVFMRFGLDSSYPVVEFYDPENNLINEVFSQDITIPLIQVIALPAAPGAKTAGKPKDQPTFRHRTRGC